ncbi:hypothetical protein CAI21_21005 [Alkalilimnicola ehrlichii]|uniref:Uncharacterized protein n=1 Tax=Alkalilimnicola ehrlichii TaxID=351052 RepID=A0A3E0WFL5_9GAMM|nr:hypothetical protein [Alkalilimnicola ehrlichii]RFA24633.1 hypothetical protein CAI21_21005 [Alkalilimnicola ehrlichii]RFA31720.1 hypothetical protein CAL65_21545 [Alkalilimnicola ehrlichii]
MAKYVGIDGHSTQNCPGNVPCKGIFVDPNDQLGDYNLYLSNESHVQVATSEASFAGQFEFLTEVAPERTHIAPEADEVTVAGRTLYFPANGGAEGSTLNIWEIDSDTGHRLEEAESPVASFAIDDSGNWGPVALVPGAHYEFELLRPGRPNHHFFRQPFLRSTHLVRLNTSPVDGDAEANTHLGPDHAALVVSRDKEWWTNASNANNDRLEVSTSSPYWGDQPALNVLREEMGNSNIGIHLHDSAERPAVSSGEILTWFHEQAFQTGADIYMPAYAPADGTITLISTPRGRSDRQQTINVPNLRSSEHRISVIFNDYIQD